MLRKGNTCYIGARNDACLSNLGARHIIGIDPNDKSGLVDYLGDGDEEAPTGSGAVDHLAFMAEDLNATRALLEQAGVATREREVPLLGLRQIFMEDPNGVTIELNFPLG